MEVHLNATAPSFAPLSAQTEALNALLALGPQRVDITSERENANATPGIPLFLRGVRHSPAMSREWYETVLPYLSKCSFVISSTTDVTYSGNIFGSTALPHIYNAITKVELPKFYWFSGIFLNRLHNPYLQMCRNLPNLQEVTFAMHPAGLTNMRWTERQVSIQEKDNPEAAKERMVLSVGEIVRFYELSALFACGKLRRVRMEYVESGMITYFCKVGNPANVIRDMKAHLEQGFAQRAMQVIVELVHIKEGP